MNFAEPSEFQSLQWQLEERFLPGHVVSLLVGIGHQPSQEEQEAIMVSLSSAGLGVVSVGIMANPWPITLRLCFALPQRQDLATPLATLLGQALEPLGWEEVSYTP